MRLRPPSERAAEAFVAALARRDFDSIEDLLDPEIRFRVLVPTGVREASGAHRTIEWLRRWFGESVAFEAAGSGVTVIGTRAALWYRFALERDGAACVIEQKGFINARVDKVSDVSLVCSGFQPLYMMQHPGELDEVRSSKERSSSSST